MNVKQILATLVGVAIVSLILVAVTCGAERPPQAPPIDPNLSDARNEVVVASREIEALEESLERLDAALAKLQAGVSASPVPPVSQASPVYSSPPVAAPQWTYQTGYELRRGAWGRTYSVPVTKLVPVGASSPVNSSGCYTLPNGMTVCPNR